MPHEESALHPMLTRLASRVPFDEADKRALLSLPHRIETIEAGRYLVREGEKPTRCYCLLEGFAYRHKIVAGGSRQIVGVHIKGDLIDLQNSMLEISDENVQALTAVRVAAVPVEAVASLIAQSAAVAKAMLKEALVYAAIFSEWIANVGRRDARSRMAHILCELSVRQEAVGLATNGSFDLPMTQEQLADALGLTPVHVNRTLKLLEKQGLIERERRTVAIADWESLKRVGDFRETYLHLGTAAAAMRPPSAG